jgi:hypothetical protein
MRECSPIFIIGRQHSGNTMLAVVFDRVPNLLSFKGEGQFFEYEAQFDRLRFESRIAAILGTLRDSDQPPLEPEIVRDIEEQLRGSGSQKLDHGEASAAQLYALGMQRIAELKGAGRWSQKATSYIFYVPRILEVFPHAKLVFLMRNPYDLLASLSRRSASQALGLDPGSVVRQLLGWNRGVKLALSYAREYQRNLLVVRYEDLATKPMATLPLVFHFAGLEFDPSYLDIPHVNRSETPYNLDGETAGINGGRVHYFRQVLSRRDQRVVRGMISKDLLRQLYPELCAGGSEPWFSFDAASVRMRGAAAVIREQISLVRQDPKHAINRIWRRVY